MWGRNNEITLGHVEHGLETFRMTMIIHLYHELRQYVRIISVSKIILDLLEC